MTPQKIMLSLLLLASTGCLQPREDRLSAEDVLQQLPTQKKLSELSAPDSSKALKAIREILLETVCDTDFVELYCLQQKDDDAEAKCLSEKNEIIAKLKRVISDDKPLMRIFLDAIPADVAQFFKFGKKLSYLVRKDRAIFKVLIRVRDEKKTDAEKKKEEELGIHMKKRVIDELNIDEAHFKHVYQQSHYLRNLLAAAGIESI